MNETIFTNTQQFQEIIKMSTDDTTNKQTDETFNKDIVEMNEESVNETTENHKVNCLFCNIIATNDPDIILEPQVSLVLFSV